MVIRTLTETHTLADEITVFTGSAPQNGWSTALDWTYFSPGSLEGIRGTYIVRGSANYIARTGTAISTNGHDIIEFEVDIYFKYGSGISYPSGTGTLQTFAQNYVVPGGTTYGITFGIYEIEHSQYSASPNAFVIFARDYQGTGAGGSGTKDIFYYSGSMPLQFPQNTFITIKWRFEKNKYARVFVSPRGTNFWVELFSNASINLQRSFDANMSALTFYYDGTTSPAECSIIETRYYIVTSVIEDLPAIIGIHDPEGNIILGIDPADDGSGTSGSGIGGAGFDDGSGNSSVGGRYIDSGGNIGVIGSSTEDNTDFSTWTFDPINYTSANGSAKGINIVRSSFDAFMNQVGFASFELSVVNCWNVLLNLSNNQVSIGQDGTSFFVGYVKEPKAPASNRYRTILNIKDFMVKLQQETFYNFAVKLQRNIEVIFSASGYTNAVHTDLTKAVTTASFSGTLISFNNDQKTWIIKPDTSADYFNVAEAISIASGTGAGTLSGSVNVITKTFDIIESLSGTEITLTSKYTDEVTADSTFAVLIIPNPDKVASKTDEDITTAIQSGGETIGNLNNDDNTFVSFYATGTDPVVLEVSGTYSGTRANVTAIEIEAKWYHQLLPLFASATFHIYMYNYTTSAYVLIKDIEIGIGIGGAGKQTGILRIPGLATDYIKSADNEFKLKFVYDNYTAETDMYYLNIVVYTDPYFNGTAFPLASKTSSTLTSSVNFETNGVDAGDTIVIGKRNDLVLQALAEEWLGDTDWTVSVDITDSAFQTKFTSADFTTSHYTSWDAIQKILARENGYVLPDYENHIIHIYTRANLPTYGLTFANVNSAVYTGIQVSMIDVQLKELDDFYSIEITGASFKGSNGQDIPVFHKAFREGGFGVVKRITDTTINSITEAKERADAEIAKRGSVDNPRYPTFTFTLISNDFINFKVGYLVYIQNHGSKSALLPIQSIHGEQYNDDWVFTLTVGWPGE